MTQPVKFINDNVLDEDENPTEQTLEVSDDTYALILEIRKLINALRRNK
jgi:hypothetical protein